MANSLLGMSVTRFPLIILISVHILTPKYTLGNIKYQTHRVTLIATNIPLKEVFNVIYKQTGLVVSNEIKETSLSEKKQVSVNFSYTEINEVMAFLLSARKELSFSLDINNKTIHIFKANKIYIKQPIDTSVNRITVSGKVTDVSGNSVPGATIIIKDSKEGTVTDENGLFHLSEIKKGGILIISSIGFQTNEVTIRDKNIFAALKPSTNLLDEKVITAYGSTTKRLNTGNISSIKSSEIEKQPINNPLLALQGRTPGIFIEQASGVPGTGVSVRIQGENSLQKGNDPFYVIDGVPYISQLLPTTTIITGSSGIQGITGNPLNYINPSDIESIEILKDADATAIYGSRAANGAVLITTKKGKVGETRVNFTLQNGWGKVGKKMKLMNAEQFLQMRHEALSNDQIAIPSKVDYDLNGQWDTTHITDWQKELIGGSARYTDLQANISGGNAQTQYFLSGGYHKETTVFPGDFSDTKGSLYFNINNTSNNQKFRIQLSAAYMADKNKLPNTDYTTTAIQLAPIAPPLYTADGSINWQPDSTGRSTFLQNPIATLDARNTNKTNSLTSNAVLSYQLTSWLTAKSNFGYNNMQTSETLLIPLSTVAPENVQYYTPLAIFGNNIMGSWLIEPTLEFKSLISKGKLSGILGATISESNKYRQSILASGFTNDLLIQDLKSAPVVQVDQTINSNYRYNALFGRLTYNWLDEYIINLTARRDGSSRFGPRSQFHNFGAMGVAWIFSQTDFIRDKLPIVSFGKLRASYGTTGNDQIEEYQFLDLYDVIPVEVPYQGVLGLIPRQIYNPYLEWEETKKLQAGFELGLNKDRIILTLNFNRNRSSNQLTSFPLPLTTGFTNIIRNLPAVVQNTGWEISLNTINIKKKNFSWNSNFNLTIPKNKLLSYTGNANTYYIVGQSIRAQHLFQYAGVNDTTGLYQFVDYKGNLTYTPSAETDQTVILNIDPKLYGGFQNSLTYKNIMLDFLFQFVKREGQDLSMGYGIPSGRFQRGLSNQSTSQLNRWQKVGDKALHQRYSSNATTYPTLLALASSNALWSDASYIRLKNVSLFWQLPDKWRKAAHLQNCRLFILGQNLLTITNYVGLDPESRGTGLPPLRVITMGAQITL